MKRYLASVILALAGLLVIAVPFVSQAAPYGTGTYGTCLYGSCNTIELSSSGAVNIDVTPIGTSRTCTVQSDTLSVTTPSSTGYTLTMSSTDTTTTMVASGSTVAANSGTPASPASLAVNRWGYRVDGLGSFGAGPTTAMSNTTAALGTFAGLPASTSPVTIATRASTPPSPDTTKVWYGICVNNTTPSGTYSRQVLYTAVIN